MMLENKKIAIVGGGPGGLTLARLLQLKGVDVVVYERDLDKNARVQGSPLDLHESSGLAALTKANLLDVFKKNFMVGADKMIITNDQAHVHFSDHDTKPEENFDSEHFRPEIDRGVLRKMLLDSLRPETLMWDSQFTSLEKKGEGWLLHFKNKNSAYADIVIAADGANSKIRPYMTYIKPFYSGITMLEGNIYNAEKSTPNIQRLLQGGKIMAFGNKKNILLGQKANGEIGFYASFKTPEDWTTDSRIDFSDRQQVISWFKKEYAEWDSIWSELFESAIIPFIPRPIYCMPFDQTWQALPNLTMIGDAAHLMPPFAGEGVNMAMLDALELSECLTSENHSSLLDAISFYEANMRQRASTAAQESVKNGERMHAEHALQNMLDFFSGHSA
jgi:2-polyprenyl-6-methoxyphenol hydroxylase-like FAD-dependent oxidoreductase